MNSLGVISRRIIGQCPLAKSILHFGGFSPPKFCINFAILSIFILLSSILYCTPVIPNLSITVDHLAFEIITVNWERRHGRFIPP